MTLIPSRHTLPLAQHIHHQECWSWQPQEHTTLLALTQQSLHKVQKDYTCYKMIWKINTRWKSYSTLFWSKQSQSNLQLFEKQNQWRTQICFSMIKTQFLFVTKSEQTIYCFQRQIKAFKTGAYSVIKSFKAAQNSFCYGSKTNNRLNARINRLFWFDSKSTTRNSFQSFSKHLSIKQSVVSTKQQVVFHLVWKTLSIKKVWEYLIFGFNQEWINTDNLPQILF